MKNTYEIKRICEDISLITKAMDIVWKVFLEFEAPEYSDEGIQEFKDFIAPNIVKKKMTNKELFIWGCFDGDNIIGVIATRPPCHISLLFVDKAYQRQGIAKTLYKTVLDYYKRYSDKREMTVNSSPYALEVYHRLGFVDTDKEQTVNGLRFIPMKHAFR